MVLNLTSIDRFIIDISNPMKNTWALSFTIFDRDFLNSLSNNSAIESVSIPKIGGMRKCFLKNINKEFGLVEIETYIKL